MAPTVPPVFARTSHRMMRHEPPGELVLPNAGSDVVRVRRASESDLDALMAIEEASFASDRMRRRQYQRHLQSDTARVLVASAGQGQVLGSAVLFLRRGSELARLYSLATLPAARGQGVAGHLLQAAEHAGVLAGARRLRLEVRSDNPVAIHLYQQHGYRRIGHCPAYYADGCDAWRYESSLF
ncbi:acetyltransferase [Frateuria aurantia DSM 6220]|uniref:Acetyltransferase n=2 Tax=Frateuria aurantia TaxID=81475 RepID=H8L315_FRAAD|nr:acetyltransferase [Frateuria aurantia DSM 6220]